MQFDCKRCNKHDISTFFLPGRLGQVQHGPLSSKERLVEPILMKPKEEQIRRIRVAIKGVDVTWKRLTVGKRYKNKTMNNGMLCCPDLFRCVHLKVFCSSIPQMLAESVVDLS